MQLIEAPLTLGVWAGGDGHLHLFHHALFAIHRFRLSPAIARASPLPVAPIEVNVCPALGGLRVSRTGIVARHDDCGFVHLIRGRPGRQERRYGGAALVIAPRREVTRWREDRTCRCRVAGGGPWHTLWRRWWRRSPARRLMGRVRGVAVPVRVGNKAPYVHANKDGRHTSESQVRADTQRKGRTEGGREREASTRYPQLFSE